MSLRKPVAGEIDVHYGQAYVESGPDAAPDLHDCFAGQRSGLCGATVPGHLFLITGLHTGAVGGRGRVGPRARHPPRRRTEGRPRREADVRTRGVDPARARTARP